MYKVLLDSNKYLLSYGAFILAGCPLNDVTDVINFDWFYPDLCTIFSIFFQIFRP